MEMGGFMAIPAMTMKGEGGRIGLDEVDFMMTS